MSKRVVLVALLLALAAFAAAPAALADSGGNDSETSGGGDASPNGPECSPGQHGNPHPGFKPGSCDN